MRSENETSGRSGSFIEAARRAQIIGAAVATVNALGYHGSSLSQIARRAGISKSVISYHFDGKEELLLEVVGHVFARVGEALGAAVHTAATPSEKLAAYVHGYLAFIAENREQMIAAVEIAVSHRDADGVSLYLVEGDDDTALLDSILAAGRATGEFGDLDPTVATVTVVHALDGALTRTQMHPETDLAAWADQLVPMLLAMLRAEPPSGGASS